MKKRKTRRSKVTKKRQPSARKPKKPRVNETDPVRLIGRGKMTIEQLIGQPPVQVKGSPAAMLERMAMLGMRKDQISFLMDFKKGELDRILSSSGSLSTAYKKGRAKGEQFVTGALFKLIIAGNIAAIIFYLKAQCGWSDRVQVDATVKHELGDTFKAAVDSAPKWVNQAIEDMPAKSRRLLETEWKRVATEPESEDEAA